MFKEFFQYLKEKQTKQIKELKKEVQQITEFNALVFKDLLDQTKGDLYGVVTLVDGTRIELHQTRFKDQNKERKYNEYW